MDYNITIGLPSFCYTRIQFHLFSEATVFSSTLCLQNKIKSIYFIFFYFLKLQQNKINIHNNIKLSFNCQHFERPPYSPLYYAYEIRIEYFTASFESVPLYKHFGKCFAAQTFLPRYSHENLKMDIKYEKCLKLEKIG